MESKNIKKYLNKFWFIVWKDDSLKGWLISIGFLFIVIKFMFLPLLSFFTGTSLPLAIVESCSMYHDTNFLFFHDFDKWWNEHELKYSPLTINNLDFIDYSFTNGFNKGDILFIVKAKPEKLKVGDVIIFDASRNNPIIHRLISIKYEEGRYIFSTLGDNNNGQLSLEREISEEQLVGKAVFKIAPYAGWGKLIFFELQRTPSERGFCREQ